MGITVAVVWGLITHGTFAGSGDELHYLMIARSIAFDGDVHLTNDYADPTNLVGAGVADEGLHVRPGRGGVPRPVHDIGLPLLAAPLVRIIYPLAQWVDTTVPRSWLNRAKLNASLLLRHQLSLLMAVVAGFIAIEIWRALRRAGFAERPAFWWALLMTLSPPLLSFSFLFFTELVAALIVLVCLRRLVEDGGLTSHSPMSRFVTGLLVGLLTLIHVRNAPVSLALALIAVVVHRHRLRALTPFSLGIAALAAIRTAIHWHFWGTLAFNEHGRLGSMTMGPNTLSEIGVRLSGLLLDQEFGLLAFAPLYLLAIPGFVRYWRVAPRLARPTGVVIAACVLSLVLPMINPYDWAAGWSPAPRFLVPIAPLLAIAVAFGASGVSGARAIFVVALVVVQVVIDVVVWNAPKLLWDLADGISTVPQALPMLLTVYAMLPAWHGPAASPWPFVIATVLWGVISVWLLRQSGPRAVDFKC